MVHLDLPVIGSEEEFCKSIAIETTKTTENKIEGLIKVCKVIFKNITPKISLGQNPLKEFEAAIEC